MIAVVIGATGLVGQSVLKMLLEDPSVSRVIAYTRRPLGLKAAKLENLVGELKDIPSHHAGMNGQFYFCCLGTTIKQAGSKEAFAAVDKVAVLDFAKVAKAHQAECFSVITAIGSSANSNVFYSQVKGQTEDELKRMGFQRLRILRPSLLLGPRHEFRLGEKLFQWTENLPIWFGPLKRYQPVQSSTVATAMVKSAKQNPDEKVWILENEDILSY